MLSTSNLNTRYWSIFTNSHALRGDTAIDSARNLTAGCDQPSSQLHIQQHRASATCFTSNSRTSQWTGTSESVTSRLHRLFRTSAINESPTDTMEGKPSATSQLLQEGFTEKQAARIMSYLASKGRRLDIVNVRQWLGILLQSNVERPFEAFAKCPIIIENRADHTEDKAAAVVAWMSRKGLSSIRIGEVLSKWPAMLIVPCANAEAVEAWLRSELDWTDDTFEQALSRCSQLFSLNPSNLSAKLAWFISIGCSKRKMSSALITNPSLFDYTLERNESQLLALQLQGLTHTEVAQLVAKKPSLITQDMLSDINQAKFRFLVQVMKFSIQELVRFPVFPTYSLFYRVGPRWSFHALHCRNRPFNISSNLANTEEVWLGRLRSLSLDAECSTRGLTRSQLFAESTIQWQQGEGKQWNFEKVKPSPGTAADDTSPVGTAMEGAPMADPPA